MTLDSQLKIVWKSGSSRNKKQHAIRWDYSRIEADWIYVRMWHSAGVRKVLPDQFISACNKNPPWSTRAFVCTVHHIHHHNVVSSGIVVIRCPVSCVLNLSIDLNSLTLAKSNWHVHKNSSACGSAAHNHKPTHVMPHSNPSPQLSHPNRVISIPETGWHRL